MKPPRKNNLLLLFTNCLKIQGFFLFLPNALRFFKINLRIYTSYLTSIAMITVYFTVFTAFKFLVLCEIKKCDC